MNVIEMLTYSDVFLLQKIAKQMGLHHDGYSKNGYIQTISLHLCDNRFLNQIVSTLSMTEMRLLMRLIAEQSHQMSIEQLLVFAKHCIWDDSSWTARTLVHRFVHQGWLYRSHRNNDETLYIFPLDLKHRLMARLVDFFVSATDSLEQLHDNVAIHEPVASAQDLKLLLQFALHHPLPLTKDGAIHQKSMKQLFELLPRRGDWHPYPERLLLLCQYALNKNLLSLVANEQLLVTTLGKEIIDGSYDTMHHSLISLWIHQYTSAIPNLRTIIYWIMTLAKQPIYVQTMIAKMTPFTFVVADETANDVLDQRIIGMMVHLGLLRASRSLSGRWVVTTTTFGLTYLNEKGREHHEKFTQIT